MAIIVRSRLWRLWEKLRRSPLVILPARLVHETPLETTWEPSSTATSQPRVFDGLNDPRVALVKDIFRAMPITTRLYGRKHGIVSKVNDMSKVKTYHGALNTVVMPTIYIGENSILVFQTAIPSYRWILNGSKRPTSGQRELARWACCSQSASRDESNMEMSRTGRS